MGVLWEQWVDGFDGSTTDTSCTTTIATADPYPETNKVTATIASAADLNDSAFAYVTDTGLLPANDQGRIRFKWASGARAAGSDAGVPGDGNHTILRVWNREGSPITIVDLYIQPTQSSSYWGCYSQAGTFRATALNTVSTTAVSNNTEYAVEVAWLGATGGGGYRKVWVDGSLIINDTGLTMVAADDCDTGQVQLGITHYDGNDGTGFTHVTRWAQLSDDAGAGLTDPVAAATAYFPLLGIG